MSPTPPEIEIQPARRSLIERLSIVWIIPFGALVIALAIAWQSFADRGPLIEIAFENATGITEDQTRLRYRDIPVGLVEEVSFNDTLDHVVVSVRLDKTVAPFVDSGASFWVVRPEVTTRGISGLDTVLSGVFIEGVWDSMPDGTQYSFDGLEDAPLVQAGERGTQILLRSTSDSGFAGDAPIIFKGSEVGRIGPTRILPDGSAAIADAVIFAPYDDLVTTATRFWDASGVSFSLGPGGAEVDFTSLASLVSGGVTFGTLVSGGAPLEVGTTFEVYPTEEAAQNSVFNPSDGETLSLSVIFDQNVDGLVTGAPVQLGGLTIGHVTGLAGLVDRERFGDRRVRLQTTVAIDPGAFGLPGEVDNEAALDFLEARVQAGMRARLANANLLTGGLKIELVIYDTPPDGALDRTTEPYPTFPSVTNEVEDLAATAEGVWRRINSLPIEDLMNAAIRVMDSAAAVIDSPELRETPGEIRGLISDVRGVVGSEDVQRLPTQIGTLMTEVETAAADLRSILGSLQEAELADRLVRAVEAAADAATTAEAGIETVTAELPAVLAQVEALLSKAEGLPVEALMAEATSILTSADAILRAEATQALPGTLETALNELRSILANLNEEGAAARLVAAVDAAGDAARGVEAATQSIPALTTDLRALAAEANALPLDTLVAELTELTAAARGLVANEGTQELPQALAQTLDQMTAVLAELQDGGAVANTNLMLRSARSAADALAEATESLPQITARLNAVLDQAGATLESFDDGSDVNRALLATLREVEEASEAVESLSRAIERQPNSLLLGR